MPQEKPDNVIDLFPEVEDDDATQWQSEEDRERLLEQGLSDDDTTLIDTTEEWAGCVPELPLPFWRRIPG